MHVRRLDTEHRRDVNQFVTFPFELYRECPQWVPPLISDAKRDLNRKRHPFYQHSTADFFVAENDGRTLGRIAVMENRRHNAYCQVRSAFFGHFDAVDDTEVSRALFAAAVEWARTRGLEEMTGPKHLIGTDAAGLLVEGFEYLPALTIPYNAPYYARLVTDAGFVRTTEHLSGYFRSGHVVPERFRRIGKRVKRRGGFRVKHFRSSGEMRQWVPNVIRVHRDAFAETEGFYPPTDDELSLIADSLLSIADPRLIKLVMKGDGVVGFAFAYPDVSLGLQRAKGRLWPWGWTHVLMDRRRTRRANANGIGVLPEVQGLGASLLLYLALADAITELGFTHVEVVQIGADNFRSRSALEALGVTWHKRHCVYRREL
jgi:GNAT superfamily N-acetyltransferase